MPAAYFRLLAATVAAGISSLTLLEAQTWNMLVLTLGATEWGHLVAPLALAALLPGWRRDRAGRIGAAIGLAAGITSLSSLARAAQVARQLPARLAAAFGEVPARERPGAPARPAPLVLRHVLRGVRSPRIGKTRHVYATHGDLKLALDLYRPAEVHEPLPCVVVIHGGSWHSGDSKQLPALNSYLAARGYVVAAINYRLAPTHRYPAARDDVQAALGYLKGRARVLGLDPEQIVLLGRSAGGHLALLAAYTIRDPAIRGVIAFYPPTDLVYGYNHPASKRLIDGISMVENFLGGSPSTVGEIYETASPTSCTGPDCPPTLLIHGGRDNLVDPVQSERLAARLAVDGCPHLYLRLPWATHGCDVNFSGPSGQISTYAVERFLAAVTAAQARHA